MKIGFMGLGRMGKAMVMNLLEQEVDVVAYNRTREKVDDLISNVKTQMSNSNAKAEKLGNLVPAYSVGDLVRQLEPPRVIWLMVPEGAPVEAMIAQLITAGIRNGDVIVNGGNCYYKESERHYNELKTKGINYLDVGVSGGLEGARKGACLMVGGDEEVFKKLEPLFKLLATDGGYAYFGPSGAGHFVKMVHNGVEYGMLQAFGEGFEILEKGPYKLDFEKVASNWSHGSVVRGWLTELLERAFKADPKLDGIEGVVGGGTTGKWTVETARHLGVKTPVINESLIAREKSQSRPTFAGKVVAALRREFGGHEITRIKK